MKGNNMQSAKVRKMDRKAKHKALSVEKTVKSRQRRLDNKAKCDAIHAIDSDMKVKVINQVTYDEDGVEIIVENGKIKYVKMDAEAMENKLLEIIKIKPTVELKTSEGFDQKLQDRIDKIEEVKAVANRPITSKVDDNIIQTIIKKWRS